RLTSLQERLFSSAYYGSLLILYLLIAGCASTWNRTPMIDGAAVESQKIISQPDMRPEFYTVQAGDTLYSIALNHGIDQKDLAQWNSIEDSGGIHIGQQLNLYPPSQPAQSSEPTLFSLPDPMLPSSAEMATPNVPPFGERHLANTDKLKVGPVAFKLPYSEQAVEQLKGLADAPPTVALKADLPAGKNVDTGIGPGPPAAEAIHGGDHVDWIWPAKGRVLEGFSESTKGIDIAGKPGQAVSASAAGKVVYSGAGLRGYGKLIIIKHNNTYLSAYAHNNKLLVKEGQTVAKGQKIAEMGTSDGGLVRLHFEIRQNGKPVDPLKHLPRMPG
ncbi:MAG: peptidoglycan DD-metalloendopeptidase family protein, partial [Nitrosospira sp.]|nr:peptidoglycan DD-metalloendopeptidase family protein [Nitrosospira sp.]